jgi:hypothetical protein
MSAAYVDAALTGELDELRDAAAGTRNATLFRTAARLYQFVEAGLLDRDMLAGQLHAAARAAGLNGREIRDTLRSAERRARGHAAQLPSHDAAAPVDLSPPDLAAPPPEAWQARAETFCDWAGRRLWGPEGRRALEWLQARGLNYRTILRAGLGFNPDDRYELRSEWGLPPEQDGQGRPRRLWIPRGIVIPWCIDGEPWRVSLRRPLSPTQRAEGEATYIQVSGGTNALYGADTLQPGQPAMVVEGVFDALAIVQEAGDLVAAVAAGTTGARRVRWIIRLAACEPVLLAFDADAGGEEAAAYWQAVLGERARRWRPLIDDPAAMLEAGMRVRDWVEAGIAGIHHQ